MENYNITISLDNRDYFFEVSEHPHHGSDSCKYRIFHQGKFVASFEPDDQHFLHICQNAANLNESVLHLLADQIEAKHPPRVDDEPQAD